MKSPCQQIGTIESIYLRPLLQIFIIKTPLVKIMLYTCPFFSLTRGMDHEIISLFR